MDLATVRKWLLVGHTDPHSVGCTRLEPYLHERGRLVDDNKFAYPCP
jgi:hypothetical protein